MGVRRHRRRGGRARRLFTADLGGQPIIVLRSASGELAALSDLCAHRSTLLMEAPETHAGSSVRNTPGRTPTADVCWPHRSLPNSTRRHTASTSVASMNGTASCWPRCIPNHDLPRPPRPHRARGRRSRHRRISSLAVAATLAGVGGQLEAGHCQCDGELSPVQGAPRNARAVQPCVGGLRCPGAFHVVGSADATVQGRRDDRRW